MAGELGSGTKAGSAKAFVLGPGLGTGEERSQVRDLGHRGLHVGKKSPNTRHTRIRLAAASEVGPAATAGARSAAKANLAVGFEICD